MVRLARYMQGEKRGQPSGKVFYAILPAYEDNEALYKVVEEIFHVKPRWFKDWGAHAVECPTEKLALMLHEAILRAPTLKATNQTLNKTLDVTPYDDPVVTKFKLTLATSSLLKTAAGELEPSIMIVGPTYPFKQFLKHQFEQIRYTDLIFDSTFSSIVKVCPLPTLARIHLLHTPLCLTRATLPLRSRL